MISSISNHNVSERRINNETKRENENRDRLVAFPIGKEKGAIFIALVFRSICLLLVYQMVGLSRCQLSY